MNPFNIEFFNQTTNFRLFQIADENSKLDEMGRKFSNRIENNVEKGVIALYEQFLLFPVFQKTFTTDM